MKFYTQLTHYRKIYFIHAGSSVAQRPSKNCFRNKIFFDRIRKKHCHFYASFCNVITRNLLTV